MKYTPSESELNQINQTFIYHAPNTDQVNRYASIRSKAKELAMVISESCPSSREKSLAFTQLQLAVMMANAAIAVNESMAATTDRDVEKIIKECGGKV